jgi:hypothetical protein
MDNAFKYVHDNKGIDDEGHYPYVGKVRLFFFVRISIFDLIILSRIKQLVNLFENLLLQHVIVLLIFQKEMKQHYKKL